MEEIIELQPTTQELIELKQSEMLRLSSELSANDYKHLRQLREQQLKVKLTLSEEDYSKLCSEQVVITDRYNALEKEVEALKIQLETEVADLEVKHKEAETDVFNNSVI